MRKKFYWFLLKRSSNLTYHLDINKFSNSKYIIHERDDEATPVPIITPKAFKNRENTKGDWIKERMVSLSNSTPKKYFSPGLQIHKPNGRFAKKIIERQKLYVLTSFRLHQFKNEKDINFQSSTNQHSKHKNHKIKPKILNHEFSSNLVKNNVPV